MKINEVRSTTWTKVAEIPMGYCLSIEGIAEAFAEGYIQVCDDGIIIWCS